MRGMKPWLIVATVALLVFAWMFRYEVTAFGPRQALVLKLDRWTGHIEQWDYESRKWQRFDADVGEEARRDFERMTPGVDLLKK